MNGWRSAIGCSSQLPGARISKIRSVRAHASVSRSVTVSTMSLPPAAGPHKRLQTDRVAFSLHEGGAMRYRMDVYTDEQAQQRRLEEDARRGLSARQKSLPAKYFYDRVGSLLFERITELDEYYPTRTEAGLLATIVPSLVGKFVHGDIVEIGAGSSGKTRALFDALNGHRRQVRYVPFDVDRSTLETSATCLVRD